MKQKIVKIRENKRVLSDAMRISVHFFIALLWVSLLWNGEAYLINTVIIAMLSVLLFPYSFHCDKKIISYFFAFFLSFLICTAEYKLFSPITHYLFRAMLTILCGTSVFYSVFSAVFFLACKTDTSSKVDYIKPKRIWTVFFFSFAVIFLTHSVVWYYVTYPGNMTPDSLSSVRQILTGEYSNHHPLIFTFTVGLFMKIGWMIFGNINAAVAVYVFASIIFMSLAFSYSTMTMYQSGVRLFWVIAAVLIFAFIPYHFLYSSTVWKDVPFAGGVLIYIVSLYRIIKPVGNNRINCLLLIIGGIIFGLGRSNGLFAFLIQCVVLFLICRKNNKLVVIHVGLVLFCLFMKHGVVYCLDVPQPDAVEYMSIPLQQVARVVVEDAEMTEQEHEFLSCVFDMTTVKNEYIPYVSDPVKNNIRSNSSDFFNAHIGEFLKMWIALGYRYPHLYIRAWIDQTKGYWNSGYDFWRWMIIIYDNDMGLVQTGHPGTINVPIQKWISFFENTPLFKPLLSIGLHVWCLLCLLYYDIIQKHRQILLIIPELLIVGTLLISTPIAYEFRYAYSVFTTLPFLLGVHWFSGEPLKQ